MLSNFVEPHRATPTLSRPLVRKTFNPKSLVWIGTNLSDLAVLDLGLQCEASRDLRQQIFKCNRLSRENNDSDPSAREVLLVFEASVHRKQYIEFGSFSSIQKLAVLKPAETSVPRRLALMPLQVGS